MRASLPPSAIVVLGVAGSGKTTLARSLASHLGYLFLDADDFHAPEARRQMAAGTPLSDEQRAPWIDQLASRLRQCKEEGRSCTLAFSGLRAEHRQRLRDCGIRVRFLFLHTPTAELVADRLASRTNHFMPPHLLPSQLQALQMPVDEEDVAVIDIDGSPQQVLERALAALGEDAAGAAMSDWKEGDGSAG